MTALFCVLVAALAGVEDQSVETKSFDGVKLVIVGGFAGLWLIRRVPQKIFEWLVVVLTSISLYFLFR